MPLRRLTRHAVLAVGLFALAALTGCHHYKSCYAQCEKGWLTTPVGVYSHQTEPYAQSCCSEGAVAHPAACNDCCGYCVWTFRPWHKWKARKGYVSSGPVMMTNESMSQPILVPGPGMHYGASPEYKKMPAPPHGEPLPMPKSVPSREGVPIKDEKKKPAEPMPMPKEVTPPKPVAPPPPASLAEPERVIAPPTPASSLQPMPKPPLLEAPPQAQPEKKAAPLPPNVRNATFDTVPPVGLSKPVVQNVRVRVFPQGERRGDERDYVIQVTNESNKPIHNACVTVECPTELKPVAVLNLSNCTTDGQSIQMAPFDLAAGSIRILKIRVHSLEAGDATLKVQLASPDLAAPIQAGK